MSTLHVTNGDVVAGRLQQLGVGDAVLPWRDVLHDGPVPASDGASLALVRARFLAGRGAAREDRLLADFMGRDAQFAAAGAGDTVVLWFEPDLYDQLQLLQILARFHIRPAGERPALALVPADALLGLLNADQLPPLFNARRTVREADLECAAQGWEAFTASDPTLLTAFTGTETALFAPGSYAGDAAVVLPYAHAAIRRVLEEYPATTNGLSRSEQQILDVLAAGERSVGDTYVAAHAPREEWSWLGDWSFAWYVERLSRAREPLLVSPPGVLEPALPDDQLAFWKQPVRLSNAGRAVQAGQADAIALNGIDRWIGGAHLTNARYWRWDASAKMLREKP